MNTKAKFRSGFIAIIGRPNAGKSTLLNRVLGSELSIVTPKAQTTRESVFGILTEPDGQIVFVDTPGIHRAREGGFNEYMVKEAQGALEQPTCIWYIVDPNSEKKHELAVLERLKGVTAPVFAVFNKCDAKSNKIFESIIADELKAQGLRVEGVVRISARKGTGVPELLAASWALMPEGPRYYEDSEQLSDRPMRFFAAEKVREQLYLQLGEEIPYSCAVNIEKFDESAKPLRIEASIFVERESQKGMVIGKGGQKIKEIGTAARLNIEKLVDRPIFLGLQVKVLKDWTKDREAMKKLGYLT